MPHNCSILLWLESRFILLGLCRFAASPLTVLSSGISVLVGGYDSTRVMFIVSLYFLVWRRARIFWCWRVVKGCVAVFLGCVVMPSVCILSTWDSELVSAWLGGVEVFVLGVVVLLRRQCCCSWWGFQNWLNCISELVLHCGRYEIELPHTIHCYLCARHSSL